MPLSFPRILIAPLLTFTSMVALAQGRGAKPAVQPPVRMIGEATKEQPQSIPGGFNLPNGWRISPAGKAIDTYGDLTLDATPSPDGRIVIASHSGYLPHGLVVIDTKTQKEVQHIDLKTVWLGMTWSPDGHTLFIPGGNATGAKNIAGSAAPIYEFQ